MIDLNSPFFILVGGLGTRISDISNNTPKPLLKIGGIPILAHIVYNLINQGITQIYLCCRSSNIGEFEIFTDEFNFNAKRRSIQIPEVGSYQGAKLMTIDTGEESSTADRFFLAVEDLSSSKIEVDNCFLTYGDSLLDINIADLIAFNNKNNFDAIITGTYPKFSYGIFRNSNGIVTEFQEKGWPKEYLISGGYFVLKPKAIFDVYFSGQSLETSILPALALQARLGCYVHGSFWHPMDNATDKKNLEDIWQKGNAPWKNWP